jgi:DNA-binding transcriptional MocR family regulator
MGLKVTFDAAPPPGAINFGIGQPSADLLPLPLFREAMDGFLESAEPLDFNYGEKQGDERFRRALAEFLGRAHGKQTTAEELFLTNGNSQALDFICDRFTRPGDTVFVEEPSYFLAFQVFRDHGLNIVGIPVDADGMQIDILEKALRRSPPALVYTIPSFNNPSGRVLSRERRQRLVELSAQHGFIIAADEVYQMLSYFGEAPPAMGTMAGQGRVLSMGSFSKILAPGLRLGWIQTSAEAMDVMLDSGWVNSGGSVNHVTSHIVRHAIESGLQETHLELLRSAYRQRLLAMEEALEAHFDGLAVWDRPDGGYFFWLELAPGVDTTKLRPPALEAGTGFMPGPFFSGSGDFSNFLRLSFAHYGVDQIRQGVALLGQVLARGG